MKLEKLKKKNYQKVIIGGLITVSLLTVLIYKTTSAKYRTTQSIDIAKGTINYKMPDLDVVAMYQTNSAGTGYDAISTVPTSGYSLNATKSVCNVNDTEDSSITIEYKDGKINISNLTKKGTKCYLYFDKIVGQTSNSIIASYRTSGKISTARKGAITTSTEMDNSKLYSVADDYGTSHVYAGTNPNNYVQFGGFWWRIIRINGDGSIRLIYNGTSSAATGAGTQITTSYSSNTVQQYNTNYNHNAYVGYMYGSTATTGSTYANTHTNTISSIIKSEVDSWYNRNLNKTGVKEKIDYNGTFCNDRKVDKTAQSSYQGDGSGTTVTGYAPWGRLASNGWKTIQNPSLKCSQSNDLFTVNGAKTATGATKGNQALAYPVGLITSDEVVLAGGFGGANRTFWLNTGQHYWTMSPYYSGGSNAFVFLVYSGGNLGAPSVNSANGVRPVINLKADIVFKTGGTGTSSAPYVVQ